MEERIYGHYYDWLVQLIGGECYRGSHYTNLLVLLFETDFYWVIPMDENRASNE